MNNNIEQLVQELLTLRKLEQMETKPIDKEILSKVIENLKGGEIDEQTTTN